MFNKLTTISVSQKACQTNLPEFYSFKNIACKQKSGDDYRYAIISFSSHVHPSSHVYLSHSSITSHLSLSVLNDKDGDHWFSQLSLCPQCKSEWTLPFRCLAQSSLGTTVKVYLLISEIVPALEMEMSLLASKSVAGALFAMLWEWSVGCGVFVVVVVAW